MAFLFAGLALGAIAISESDRRRYQSERAGYQYLGHRDGMDVHYDRMLGIYYIEDGWDIRRLGKPGAKINPVDMERLQKIFNKYDPSEVRWAHFILTMYAGKERELWNKLYFQYERPKKPKKPTAVISDSWSKSIRKGRWERYEEELEAYEKKLEVSDTKYRKENAMWKRRKEGSLRNSSVNSMGSAGRQLLQQAMGTDVRVRCVIPPGGIPGNQMAIIHEGKKYNVLVPAGTQPGQEIEVVLPRNTAPSPPKPKSVPAIEPPALPQRRTTTPIPSPAPSPEPITSTANGHTNSNGANAPSLPRVNSFEF